jgi:lysozyme family protein
MTLQYPKSFEHAVNHAMLYEVGSHWNVDIPGVREGLIATREQRRNVGYVNDPLDNGGETKYGVARRPNPDLDITNIDWEAAKRVYFRRYWLAANCDDLTLMSARLAVLHFDGAVNHGVGRAGRFLQRAVGATEDGDVGPATLRAVSRAISARGDIAICHLICDFRTAFYEAIIARNPSQERFRRGWMRRINEMREYTTNPNVSFD